MGIKKMSLANIEGKLSRAEMKQIMAGSGGGSGCGGGGNPACNPYPYYNHACTSNANCGAPLCTGTLYCYIAPKQSTGVCLFC